MDELFYIINDHKFGYKAVEHFGLEWFVGGGCEHHSKFGPPRIDYDASV